MTTITATKPTTVKIESQELFSHTNCYDLLGFVDRDGEDIEWRATLTVFDDNNIAIPEYDLTIIESEKELTEEEQDQILEEATNNF